MENSGKTRTKNPQNMSAFEFREGIINGTNLALPMHKVIRELNKERLDNIAVETDTRTYTYRQMFRTWDNYAEVFSGLGITYKNKSRAIIIYPNCMELLCAEFALNMTGTTVSTHDIIIGEDYNEVIKREKITDVIALDIGLTPELCETMLNGKDETGLRNIIIIPNSIVRNKISPFENFVIDQNYFRLRHIKGLLFMDDLLREYETTPIVYADEKKDFISILFHTSGSTQGIRKPIPFTNSQINAAASFVLKDERFTKFEGNGRVLIESDFSHAYFHNDEMMVAFFLGCTIVFTYFTQLSKDYLKFVRDKKINILICAVLQHLLLSDFFDGSEADISCVELVICGGQGMSVEGKIKVNSLLKKYGSNAKALLGYGLSEIGGACMLSKDDGEVNDSTGYLLPGYSAKIYDENTGEFYDPREGMVGGLYISSDSISSGLLDGKQLFKNTKIDGKDYICTNDLFRVNEDGSFTCCGRMNNFFINNDGVRFDAGLIESELSKENGIRECIISAGFNKTINDTVPILYVLADENTSRSETVKKALIKVFTESDIIKKTNIPPHLVLVDKIPYKDSGKIDRYGLDDKSISHEHYDVKPIKNGDKLIDIILIPTPVFKTVSTILPDEIEKKKKNTIFGLIDDPNPFAKIPPEGITYCMSDWMESFAKRVLNKGNKEKNESENKDEGMKNPFPPFPWLKNMWNQDDNNKSPFPFLPFCFEKEEKNEDEEKAPFIFELIEYMKKKELTKEETGEILDRVQDFLSLFYNTERVHYKF